ncbi:MAG: hypothetical protein HZB68_01460 [Candidatus Aenigmarchaeota archaeon]|nr:hypothetical protein [Candidatus Aenigmarchaeota archaeon]
MGIFSKKQNSIMKRLGVYDALEEKNLSHLLPMIEKSMEPFKANTEGELKVVSTYSQIIESESPKYVEETINAISSFIQKRVEEKPGRLQTYIAQKAEALAGKNRASYNVMRNNGNKT